MSVQIYVKLKIVKNYLDLRPNAKIGYNKCNCFRNGYFSVFTHFVKYLAAHPCI